MKIGPRDASVGVFFPIFGADCGWGLLLLFDLLEEVG